MKQLCKIIYKTFFPGIAGNGQRIRMRLPRLFRDWPREHRRAISERISK